MYGTELVPSLIGARYIKDLFELFEDAVSLESIQDDQLLKLRVPIKKDQDSWKPPPSNFIFATRFHMLVLSYLSASAPREAMSQACCTSAPSSQQGPFKRIPF